MSLHEVNEASLVIQKAAHENANIIFGAVQDESLKDQVKITVIAAGFKEAPARRLSQQKPAYLPKEWKASHAVAAAGGGGVVAASGGGGRGADSIVAQVARNVSSVTGEIASDDLDVPTFLRRSQKS
jgi:hypothetical protein